MSFRENRSFEHVLDHHEGLKPEEPSEEGTDISEILVSGVRDTDGLTGSPELVGEECPLEGVEDAYDINLSQLMPASLVTIPVTVGEVEYSALIDTGSNASIIQQSLIGGGAVMHGTEKIIAGLGSDQGKPLGCTEVLLKLGGLKMVSASFLVVPDQAVKYPIILGASFFKVNNITINLNSRRVAGIAEEGAWKIYLPTKEEPLRVVVRQVPIFAAQTVILDKSHQQLVPATVASYFTWIPNKNTADYYYDGQVDPRMKGKVVGKEGVLRLEDDFQVLLSQSFEGDRGQEIIHKGEMIGTVSTIVDIGMGSVDEGSLEHSTIDAAVTLDHLSDEQAARVKAMLYLRVEVFSRGDQDFCQAQLTQHKIELHDYTPIRQKPRRFPAPIADKIERQCEELTNLDILEKSKSPWCAPIVPLWKKDESLRLCIDYRKLNSVTRDDRFPLPNVNDLVFSLYGMKYFTTLDLVRGFYQIPLEEASRELTAFSTQRSHYQSKSLCFGLKNAPAAFQREMQQVLKEFHEKQVLVYIDDILIMSSSFEEHLSLVGKVLETLRRYSIKIKPSKCHWFKSEVAFLGHLVGVDGLRKSPEYMASVVEFPRPVTVKDLRSFLGLLNFQRKFIANCSQIAQPLSRLTGGSSKHKLLWTNEMVTAFNALREAMQEDLSLAYPDYSSTARQLELSADASAIGAGACLGQVQHDNFRIIAYASMSFSRAQRNYSTLDRELTALRWSVKTFRAFLYGISFVLYTDHKPLLYMNNMCRVDGRVMRTMQDLADYNFEIRFKAGRDNVAADVLSRLPGGCPDGLCSSTAELPDGLEVLKVIEGGGDSMVSSLYWSLHHHQRTYDLKIFPHSSVVILREQLVKELLDNSQRYFEALSKAQKKELKMMQFPGQSLTEKILLVASFLYRVEVWVHHGMCKPVVFSLGEFSQRPESRIHLQCLAGIHYNPLAETPQYRPSTCRDVKMEVPGALLEDDDDSDDEDLAALFSRYEHLKLSCAGRHNREESATIVMMGAHCCCALVDSGACVSLVNGQTLQDTMIKPEVVSSEVVTLRGIGDGRVATSGIVWLSLSFNGTVVPEFPFAIVDSNTLPFCIVLGCNFIEKFACDISYSKGIFHLQVGKPTSLHFLESHSCGAQADSTFYFSGLCSVSDSGPQEPSEGMLSDLFQEDQVHRMQKQDATLRSLGQHINRRIPSKNWHRPCLQAYKRYHDRIFSWRDLLWFRGASFSVIVVSRCFLIDILVTLHLQMAHIGRNKLIDLITQHCWNPALDSVAADVCSSCPHCQVFKVSRQAVTPPTYQIT